MRQLSEDELKLAVLKVFKNGDKLDPNNYREICVTVNLGSHLQHPKQKSLDCLDEIETKGNRNLIYEHFYLHTTFQVK